MRGVATTFFRIYASADTQQRDKGNASRARSPDPIQGQATDHSARRIGSRSAAWRCGRDLRGAVRGVERGVARRGEARGLCPSTRPGPCGSSTGFPSPWAWPQSAGTRSTIAAAAVVAALAAAAGRLGQRSGCARTPVRWMWRQGQGRARMVSIEQDQGGRDKEASQLGPAAAAGGAESGGA